MSHPEERRESRVDSTRDHVSARFGSTLGFMRHIWALDHAIQSISKRMRTQTGLTGPQRLVVRVLGRTPEVSAGALARTLHLHPSTVTGILQRLERMGLVSRVTDPGDQRRILLHLTAKGRTYDRPSPGTIEASVDRVLGRLSKFQIDTATDVLRDLVRELDMTTAPKSKRRREASDEDSLPSNRQVATGRSRSRTAGGG